MVGSNVTYLSRLKELYQNRRVSILVGAGFSKNACPVFPSWNELLFDMVVELYQDEIETALLRYRKLNPLTSISLAEFQKKEVPILLSRKGYLRVVSDYINRKGFRESIEQYIEERVPYIDAANNQFRFTGKNESIVIDINPDYFSAHVKLVKGSCWERIYTTNYDRLLEHAAEISDLEINTITQAHKLSVYCDDPTIIKLHGDLYNPLYPPRDFRFDGNSHQQYIISEEDYRNYPKDHEAFTQLMRISLLQGYFCLIGFSGDDPNFVNWIEWVRDILVKDDDRSTAQEEKKIFLIGLSKDLPQSDKQLFYDNHRIVYIPLLSDEVMAEIGAQVEGSSRDVFVHLFDYLEPDKERKVDATEDGKGPKDVVSPEDVASLQDKVPADTKEENADSSNKEDEDRKEYQHLWNRVFESKINGTPPHFTHTLVVDEDKLARLRQIKIWNRFVNYSDQQKIYLGIIEGHERLTIPEAQLAILALKDSGITVDQNMAKLISESGVGDEDLKQLQALIDRTETLLQVWESKESVIVSYERIIRQLFSLNFSASKRLLKEWKAEGVDILKKAMLLSFFMEDGAKELLVEFLKNETNLKERYYATRLLNMIEGAFPAVHSLARFENANVQNYYEVISNYIRRVVEEKIKIGRYGDGKNEKITYMDGKPSKTPEAMAVLNFLIDAPCFVSFRNFYILVNPDNWYPIHKNLFELYPYATLFYSLQCSDKKVRVRIGQDYAYSDKLAHSCLGEVLVSLLKTLVSNDTPWYLKESILQVSKEMFVAVSSSKWEWHFMQVWDELVMSSRFNQTESRINDALDLFINKGLNSITNKQLRQRIIRDVLTNSKKDTTFVINCLYYLSVVKVDGDSNDRLSRAVDEFITQISMPEEITIAGNIYRVLTEEQKEAVSSKCVEVLNAHRGQKIDEVVFRSAHFFMKDSTEGRRVFVAAVYESPLLWKNGVMGNGGFSSFTYLSISNFARRIYIDQDSLLRFYEKMKVSLNELVAFYDLRKSVPVLGDVDGLLAEMLSFLNYYEKRLQSQDDYVEIRNKVKAYHQEISGLMAVEDGLRSPYEDEVKKALSFIFINRDTIKHKDIVRYMNMVISRVLMKNSDGLDTCVAYLRLYLNEGIISKEDEEIIDGMVQLLDRFTKDVAQECNMELVMTTRDMAKIAKSLSGKGYASRGIEYWIKLQKSGRFYSNFS